MTATQITRTPTIDANVIAGTLVLTFSNGEELRVNPAILTDAIRDEAVATTGWVLTHKRSLKVDPCLEDVRLEYEHGTHLPLVGAIYNLVTEARDILRAKPPLRKAPDRAAVRHAVQHIVHQAD